MFPTAPKPACSECNCTKPAIPSRTSAASKARAGSREIARESGPRDLLICVISGGASALMPLPRPGITLAKKKSITKRLLASGADHS